LSNEAGSDVAARALAAAGHAAGDALFTHLHGGDAANDSTDSISEAAFWRKLATLFGARGWGTLSHADAHQGVGALQADDWVEADPESNARRPSCFFTTGMLANILGNAAGAPISVLEVECRSQGDERCRFLFGSQEAMQVVYDRVGHGVAVDAALNELV